MAKPKKKFRNNEIKQGPRPMPKFFDSKTFENWEVTKPKRHCYILTNIEDGADESFRISLDINTSLDVEMDIVYCEKVVIYRGKITGKMKKFWYDLGSLEFNQANFQTDALRNVALDNYTWEF